MSATEHVVLVDRADRPIGAAEKLLAHRRGLLHRAISVFVFDSAGRMLIQRRALGKYHSAGLWSNTACSHPRPGEPAAAAAVRRLREEMGLTCPVEHAFSFIYRVDLGDGLTEHEYDRVFLGQCDARPDPDPEEVLDWRFLQPAAIRREMATRPDRFTYWFRIAFTMLERHRLVLPARELVGDRIA